MTPGFTCKDMSRLAARAAVDDRRDPFLRLIGVKPVIRGILSVTPDSLSGGGRFRALDALAFRERKGKFGDNPNAPVRKDFPATRASSRTWPPAGDMTFKGLDHACSDDQHDRREGQRIGEEQRDVEQLKRDIDFEPPAIRPAINSTTSRDLPDRATGPRGSPRRKTARAGARRRG
jgi:hypothetical protein